MVWDELQGPQPKHAWHNLRVQAGYRLDRHPQDDAHTLVTGKVCVWLQKRQPTFLTPITHIWPWQQYNLPNCSLVNMSWFYPMLPASGRSGTVLAHKGMFTGSISSALVIVETNKGAPWIHRMSFYVTQINRGCIDFEFGSTSSRKKTMKPKLRAYSFWTKNSPYLKPVATGSPCRYI